MKKRKEDVVEMTNRKGNGDLLEGGGIVWEYEGKVKRSKEAFDAAASTRSVVEGVGKRLADAARELVSDGVEAEAVKQGFMRHVESTVEKIQGDELEDIGSPSKQSDRTGKQGADRTDSGVFAILDAVREMLLERNGESEEGSLIDATLAVQVVESVCMAAPIAELVRRVDDFSEKVLGILGVESFWRSTYAWLRVMRAVRRLLERGSKVTDPKFFGTVVAMLTAVADIWHRSGVNYKGNFHIELRHPDEGAGKEKESDPVDWALYKIIWTLHNLIVDVPKSVTEIGFKDASDALEKVLKAFESNAPVLSEKSHPPHDDRFLFLLSEPKLIRMQLNDRFFRNHVLTQILFWLQYVEEQLPRFEYRVQEYKKRVWKLLDNRYAAVVSSVLDDERHWASWKRAGCPNLVPKEYVIPEEMLPVIEETRKRRRSTAADGNGPEEALRKRRAVMMGDESVEEKWRTKSAEERNKELQEVGEGMLSVDGILERLKRDVDGEVEETERIKNSKNFVWRSLRALLRKDLDLFTKVTKADLDLDVLMNEQEVRKEANQEAQQEGKQGEQAEESIDASTVRT